MPRATEPDDAGLKRLGGGRWQTRDGRFTIEPQSGTWVVVDAEQTDDLGLPLIRGPYRSLAAARTAIAEVRGSAAPASPLAERIAAAPPPPDRRPASRGASVRRGSRKAAPAEADGTHEVAEEREEPPPPPVPKIPADVTVETIWIVEADYAPDAAERRPRFRLAHLERIRDLLRDGTLIEAGGYLDFSSALLLVRADSEREAIELFRKDVYVDGGVWTGEIRARPFGRVVVGGGRAGATEQEAAADDGR